jgi:hypothetical protein
MRGTMLRLTAAAFVTAATAGATGATASAATFTVTTTADTGAGSLRDAITSANAASGPDDVRFNIPGSGAKTISVTSAPLPIVAGRLKIDGATQPGFAGVAEELRGDIAVAEGDRALARKSYEKALASLDQAAPTRHLVELKLIDAGGQPPAQPET